MRVALLAETYLPHMNGVVGSVLHALRHLAGAGHETLVIAPQAPEAIAAVHAAQTELLRSLPLPSYPQVRIVFARTARIAAILREFRPDVVHLASPFVLGWQGVVAAGALGVPSVAVYQTDVVGYTERYGVPAARAAAAAHVARLHRRATLTLAPSSSATAQLETLGVDRLRHWGRGVDAERFHPRRRDESWRAMVAPGQKIIGYVGRLAPEKQVADLAALNGIPGTRLVIVGDGPARPALEASLPGALFTGHLGGEVLAAAVASFDVFVHPGESETFGQTIQEAMASAVPVVATGRGGPTDIVRSSVDGWLYRPGDLSEMRGRVGDLLGDDAKRRAFADSARTAMAGRSWDALCRELVERYGEARELHRLDAASLVRPPVRPETVTPRSARPTWSRYIALGDSLTEGLCDTSRMPDGQFRGWADRLAELLAQGGTAPRFRYANLAVRSRRVRDLVDEQIPRALQLQPDLVSILMGSNDLIGGRVTTDALAAELEQGVRRLRDAGCDVLLVTPFLPRRTAAMIFARRFARFASEVRRIARETGAILLDIERYPEIGDMELWADDKVHLRAPGHRLIAYRAAELLGVPDAETLGELDAALHADEAPRPGSWLRRDVLPWAWRRLRGRTAGDGVRAKHDDYIDLPTGQQRRVFANET